MGFRAPVELIPISTHVPLVPHLILFPTLLAAARDRGRNLFFLQLQVQSHPRSLLPTPNSQPYLSCHHKSFHLFQISSTLQFRGHFIPQLDRVPLCLSLRNSASFSPCLLGAALLHPSPPPIFPLARTTSLHREGTLTGRFLTWHSHAFLHRFLSFLLCEKTWAFAAGGGLHHSLPRAGEGTVSIPLLRELWVTLSHQ